jgi:hypothetical protein
MIYPQRLESLNASIVAKLDLPTPKSEKFSFRLTRLPFSGLETTIDLVDYRSRVMLKVSRVLTPLRQILDSDKQLKPQVEISCGYIDRNEYLLSELKRLSEAKIYNDLEDSEQSSHFFMFYTDSYSCTIASISNPHEKKWAELWQRIINRSYGLEHQVARRHLRTCNLLHK